MSCPPVGHAYMSDIYWCGGDFPFQCRWLFTDFVRTSSYSWGCMGTCRYCGQTPHLWCLDAEFMCGANGGPYEGMMYIRYYHSSCGWTEWAECALTDTDLIWSPGTPYAIYLHKIY